MVLAHQFLGQLPESLRKAVFGNVGTFIAFQTGAEDALMIAKELGLPNPEVLVDLEPHHAYRRQGLDTVLFKTIPPAPQGNRLTRNVRNTRSRFARSWTKVQTR